MHDEPVGVIAPEQPGRSRCDRMQREPLTGAQGREGDRRYTQCRFEMCHAKSMPESKPGIRYSLRMRRAVGEPDSWRRMVLQALPPVAWLGPDAPEVDVVLSSRSRFMRNLAGRRFPNAATPADLSEVQQEILDAVRLAELDLEPMRGMTSGERDCLVGSRIVSHDFAWQDVGRSLLLDKARKLSLMVNEEDHIRLQALTAGWSPGTARAAASQVLRKLATRLEFAQAPQFGFLAASPGNCGQGSRLSAMLHLIGLAQAQRLPRILRAAAEKGLVARGLFGESSRAIGAFVQISVVDGKDHEFVGACEYLIAEERNARGDVPPSQISERLDQTLAFARTSRTLSLAHALRALAWVRFGASASLPGVPANVREVDAILTKLELRTVQDSTEADRQRADYLRKALGL